MVFIVTVLVGIAVHIATGNFFTSYNISTLSRAASFAIIVGFGQTICLLYTSIQMIIHILYLLFQDWELHGGEMTFTQVFQE